uniref:Uncharacterized protein n=1 Tax=Candidatus Kentrum sp. TC TaxID=2126339 RepID=A0A450Z8T8_9GAMM|nr:MAG: hypothetical protein BECKTC1821D_GA0114238_10943 [Candidatus Kentron sp. TC]
MLFIILPVSFNSVASETIKLLDELLDSYMGKDIMFLVKRIGLPSGSYEIYDKVVYVWRTHNNGNFCEIKIVMSPEKTILFGDVVGYYANCLLFLNDLVEEK